MTFNRFVAIDWSGAKGSELPGLAIAVAEAGEGPPRLIRPAGGWRWTREQVLAFILNLAEEGGALIGADFSFSLPFVDEDSYFPGADSPVSRAEALWRLVEEESARDGHLYAGALTESEPYAAHFRRPGHVGGRYSPRLRVTEALCREKGYGPAQSVFNLIGPAQVGRSSLSGIRMLARLEQAHGALAVWPFKAPRSGASCLVEMYTRLFLNRAGVRGGKVRDLDTLDAGLRTLGSAPLSSDQHAPFSDHETDVLLSAVGLRQMVAEGAPGLWNPPALSDTVRRTEGWTFGVI